MQKVASASLRGQLGYVEKAQLRSGEGTKGPEATCSGVLQGADRSLGKREAPQT